MLVTASVAPAEGCGDVDPKGAHGQPSLAGTGAAAHSGASGTGGLGGSGGVAGTTMTGGAARSGTGVPPVATAGSSGSGGQASDRDAGGPPGAPPGTCTFTVQLPPEGVPAEPGQICAATVTPVDSNRAARVQLQSVNDNPAHVMGTIEIAPSLLGMVVGKPTVEVIDATDPGLLQLTVTAVEANPAGFGFEARWPAGITFLPNDMTRITMRVSFEAACPDAPQLVHSVTDVHLCDLDGAPLRWVSSGSVCSVCRIIAEMAPSPIVPDAAADELPLARVLRLRIVELARVAESVVLLAEHDGGADVEYDWSASAGRIERLAPDVIALRVADLHAIAPLVQVAAFSSDAAAVCSWSFNAEVS